MPTVAPHRFHPTILREYDIRGIVGETLSVADARWIGRAFGSRIVESGGRNAAVGYDGRLSSPMLEEAVSEGLMECGLEVCRAGRGPTPMLYYATTILQAGGGIMVTGSHNPPNHNGFKMMLAGKPFHGAAIKSLGDIAASGDFQQTELAGQARQIHVFESYVDRLCRDYRPGRPLRVVWDAGNGAAGEAMTRLTQRLPGQHRLLFAEIDGQFPNHHPDPTVPANLADLQAAVIADRADLGIAFDGDGDRIGVVDGQGRILWGDQLMVLLARDLLAERPGATIIADVKASQVLFDEIATAGGRPLMWKTGHSLIKTKMAETGAPLAGEMSGHIFFADRYYGFDDALYAAVRLLSILANRPESLVELRDGLPSVVSTPELRFPCGEAQKFAIVEQVKARLQAAGATVDATDGVRVSTADGWWLLRASNTQAVLVARCEAANAAGLERLKTELVALLQGAGIAAPDFGGGGGH